MPNYIAITIGPIYRTISLARATRELWGASYMFSYLMKQLSSEIFKNKARKFYQPHITDEMFKPRKDGAGIFVDHIIFEKAPDDNLAVMKDIIQVVFKSFARIVKSKLESSIAETTILNYLENYIKIHAIEIELPDTANPILEISTYLDNLEMWENWNQEEPINYLAEFLNQCNASGLTKDGFGEGRYSFKTLVEIAAEEFREEEAYATIRKKREHNRSKKDDDKDDEKLIVELHKKQKEENKDDFKPGHKYVAIVHADGDRIGALLKTLKVGELTGFSERLTGFAQEAVGLISQYGGMNIHAGGDDLMFFAPVFNKNSLLKNENNNISHIFQLLDVLNSAFKKKFTGMPVIPTLSFGVSITFYKFPLYEALEESRRQLFSIAKQTKEKNAIGLRLLKHSGAAEQSTLHINSPSYTAFNQLIESSLLDKKQKLSSVLHLIPKTEQMFEIIGSSKEKLENFMASSFNETVHKQANRQSYLSSISTLIASVFNEHGDEATAIKESTSLLSIIHFLTSKEEDR